jgi:hypothetical protein
LTLARSSSSRSWQRLTSAHGRSPVFYRIIGHFEAIETTRSSKRPPGSKQYNRPAFVRLTFKYTRTPESQDKFLQAFFSCMALDIDEDDNLNLDDDDDDSIATDLNQALSDFADYLLNYFFLPCTYFPKAD